MRIKLKIGRREDRARIITEIKTKLGLEDGMTGEEKVRGVVGYLKANPHVPVTFACEAPDVSYYCVLYRLYRAKGEFTAFAARRDTALRLIAEFHPDKGTLVNQANLLRAIHARGFRLSINTLRDILKSNGYVLTTSGNEARINGLGRMIITSRAGSPGPDAPRLRARPLAPSDRAAVPFGLR